MKLNLHPLRKALGSLQLALEEQVKQQNDFLRDSCIQRFEYTYELSWKMLKRHLEQTESTTSNIDALTFADLIRKGNEKNLLLSDWSKWKIYREARNNTSHGYNEDKANDVFKVIPDFFKESKSASAQFLTVILRTFLFKYLLSFFLIPSD